MQKPAEVFEQRSDEGARPVRTVLAFSVMMLGLAATLAIVPTLIWLFASRGLQ